MHTGSVEPAPNDETDTNKAESVNSYDSIEYSPRLPDPFPSTIPNDNTVKLAVPGPVGSEMDLTMGGTEDDGSGVSQKKTNQEAVSTESDVNCPPPADATSQTKASTKRETPIDPDFLEAAQENKGNSDSEWQFSSDDEASDEEALSADEEDSDEEECYSPMNAAEMAQLLMREDGGYDNSPPVCTPHRTKNEIAEDEAEPDKPNILLTQDMEIKPVGFVKSIVGKLVLIEASDPGHQRVLGEGSVLAFEDRTVLGVVSEVLGRVEMPLYTVRFKSPEEIKELGVNVERKVFSVVQHSEFVFTQPLKAIKGSDASNLYDEEVPITEQEFSDDEAEAEFKKSLKEARQEKRGDRGGGRGDGGGSSTRGSGTHGRYGRGRGWESREQVPTQIDEPYIPLARPANLQEMYTSEPPPPPSAYGGQRGSNRKRGDKGRGRGSHRSKDSFAGRGGRRGSHSQNDSDRPQLPTPVPTSGHNTQSNQPFPSFQQPSPYTFPSQWPTPEQQAEFIRLMQGQTGQWPSTSQFPMGPPFSLPPHPQYQQFQQQQAVYQTQQQQQQGSHSAGQPNLQQQQFRNLPTGAYINPAFWGGRGQAPQAQASQVHTNYSPPAPTQQSPAPADETATTRTVRESLEILKNLSK
ncbi:NAF1-domain-containing protein [Tuber magnatum]|uniref:H/ACA ribonucleoprotein complex non-core subunit NAF1 n=1 Tax=Tuber magnatum TaxID=42249 RepID=A0A317SLR5_9PEZI|nr:NAF1-domain-containing protein [Tuber magnatum]